MGRVMKDQTNLVDFILEEKILKFGDFLTNSGRKTPYFCNFGTLADPLKLEALGHFYADKIIDAFGDKVDNVFGPAYKGISLAITVASSLSKKLGKKVTFTFNRKEQKDHGEKGLFVGQSYHKGENVVLVEDVLTSGKSLEGAYALLKKEKCHILGSVVCIDRQEKNLQNKNAKKALELSSKIPLYSLIQIDDILKTLETKMSTNNLGLNNSILNSVKKYQETYLSHS